MTDFFKNYEHDIQRAIEEFFEEKYDSDKFSVQYHESVLLSWILSRTTASYVAHLPPESLKKASTNQLYEKLADYNGEEWAKLALTWLTEGFPAIVLVVIDSDVGPPEYVLGDGQHRLSLAQAVGTETIPVIIVSRRVRQ